MFGESHSRHVVENSKDIITSTFYMILINLFSADQKNFTSREWEIIKKSVIEYSKNDEDNANDEDNDVPLTKNQQSCVEKTDQNDDAASSEQEEDSILVDNATQTGDDLGGKKPRILKNSDASGLVLNKQQVQRQNSRTATRFSIKYNDFNTKTENQVSVSDKPTTTKDLMGSLNAAISSLVSATQAMKNAADSVSNVSLKANKNDWPMQSLN